MAVITFFLTHPLRRQHPTKKSRTIKGATSSLHVRTPPYRLYPVEVAKEPFTHKKKAVYDSKQMDTRTTNAQSDGTKNETAIRVLSALLLKSNHTKQNNWVPATIINALNFTRLNIANKTPPKANAISWKRFG